MASVNKAIIIGNLGKDPELRHTQSGTAVTELAVATTETWKDSSGERQEKTEWHRIVVWGKQAENCAQYLEKGRPVYVEGRIQTRKYQDRDGNERYITEIVADRVQFLGAGGQGGGQGRGQGAIRAEDGPDGYRPSGARSIPDPAGEDDIPF